jgi:hypothetical protein
MSPTPIHTTLVIDRYSRLFQNSFLLLMTLTLVLRSKFVVMNLPSRSAENFCSSRSFVFLSVFPFFSIPDPVSGVKKIPVYVFLTQKIDSKLL